MSARDQYLEALGIDRWTARVRRAPQLSAPPGAEPLSASASAPGVAALAAPADASRQRLADPRSPIGEQAWQTLQAEVSGCQRCDLCQTRTQTVFGVGNPRPQLLVVGEAPGAEEDHQGEPFVGRAGQLLNSMLRAMGYARESVFIANVLKCRPPGNRDPSPTEVARCMPYLQRQLQILQPRLILAVGRIAAQNLLATDTPIGRLRGQLHRFGNTPLIVTYHPAYLLRSPGEKRKAWLDLKFVSAELAQLH